MYELHLHLSILLDLPVFDYIHGMQAGINSSDMKVLGKLEEALQQHTSVSNMSTTSASIKESSLSSKQATAAKLPKQVRANRCMPSGK